MRLLIISSLILFQFPNMLAQNSAGNVNWKENIYLFFESVPKEQYRHLGVVECARISPEKEDPMIDHIIKQAKKDFEEFDGLIFRPDFNYCKVDVIQFYKDPKARRKRPKRGEEIPQDPKHKMSVANEEDGVFIFIQNSPVSKTKLLGKVEAPVLFKSDKPADLLEEVLRVAKQRYPDMEGLVFVSGSNMRKANAVKFVE